MGDCLVKCALVITQSQLQDAEIVDSQWILQHINEEIQESCLQRNAVILEGTVDSSRSQSSSYKSHRMTIETCITCLTISQQQHKEYSVETVVPNCPQSSLFIPGFRRSQSESSLVSSCRAMTCRHSLRQAGRYKTHTPYYINVQEDACQEPIVRHEAGLKASSKLPRHELAFTLGQMRNEAGDALGRNAHNMIFIVLTDALKNSNESPIDRHECATALGEIDKKDCMQVLEEYLHDDEAGVIGSCQLSLDMYAHSLLSK
uniref:Uncharacterized protein LOC100373600 n=1 Tax=Saccoglossus kowalevskii TaxID=10224 RepID=A0ABM0N1F9_SACKO|nr:PREDICTED: uncharacterized protein LOC100373600 [Saccoglossus kowalevskii]